MSRIVPVLSAEEAVKLVPAGATVSVSSSSGLGCPDAVLAALGARYVADGGGGDLTLLHPIAAGDMYGIDGIDHLTSPDRSSASSPARIRAARRRPPHRRS